MIFGTITKHNCSHSRIDIPFSSSNRSPSHRTSSASSFILLLTVFAASSTAQVDYYAALRLFSGASDELVKRAFFNCSLVMYPHYLEAKRAIKEEEKRDDRVRAKSAADDERQALLAHFAYCSYAYQVLSDKQRRELYDDYLQRLIGFLQRRAAAQARGVPLPPDSEAPADPLADARFQDPVMHFVRFNETNAEWVAAYLAERDSWARAIWGTALAAGGVVLFIWYQRRARAASAAEMEELAASESEDKRLLYELRMQEKAAAEREREEERKAAAEKAERVAELRAKGKPIEWDEETEAAFAEQFGDVAGEAEAPAKKKSQKQQQKQQQQATQALETSGGDRGNGGGGLRCVPCKKNFKSAAQLENHYQSAKHKKNVKGK